MQLESFPEIDIEGVVSFTGTEIDPDIRARMFIEFYPQTGSCRRMNIGELMRARLRHRIKIGEQHITE